MAPSIETLEVAIPAYSASQTPMKATISNGSGDDQGSRADAFEESIPHLSISDDYAVSEEPLGTIRPIRVICIGAGASGVNLAYQFQKNMQNPSLVIYEKNPAVGGTWFENRYPGCKCDIRQLLLYTANIPQSGLRRMHSVSIAQLSVVGFVEDIHYMKQEKHNKYCPLYKRTFLYDGLLTWMSLAPLLLLLKYATLQDSYRRLLEDPLQLVLTGSIAS